MARSCFRVRKTSHFLKDLNSTISSGRHNVFSRHSTTRLELPFVGSLRLASSNTGLPKLGVKIGLQMEAFFSWSPPTSLEVPVEANFFGCPFPFRASLAGGWWEDYVTSPSSIPSTFFPPWTLFLFLSLTFVGDACVMVEVGGQGTTAMAGEEPLAWAISRASRSGVFSSKPMSSKVRACDELGPSLW